MKTKLKPASSLSRPPVIAVLGHVDHGKTTLLDSIRKSSVASSESGGITQQIGAYQITTDTHGQLTFIDTPGHEIFKQLRSRGADVADIILLVISATDGVMPQTIESIELIKKSEIPFIVVVNKMDLPTTDIDKIKQQLTKYSILVEGYGGEIVIVPVSAKTGKGIKELIEMILLVSEMKGLRQSNNPNELGVVIEARLDKHRGSIATVICKQGVLKVGQTIYTDTTSAKIRALINDKAVMVKEAKVSEPVEVMGWQALPKIGTRVFSQPITQSTFSSPISAKSLQLIPLESFTRLKVILKADVLGSIEAILSHLNDSIDLIQAETGDINESDILSAKSTGALIIGFNVKAGNSAKKLAEIENVKLKIYTIIYELLDEIKEVSEILRNPKALEEVLGEAEILAEFVSDEARVAGCKVKSGRIARGDLVILKRKQNEIGRTKIKTLKFRKDIISVSQEGSECGILFDKQLDFKIGDTIISYKINDLLA